jgi:hypothetical protein
MDRDAYFAGLFDGEGSVGIYAVGDPGRDNWAVRLAIVGTHRPMIEAAWHHFGVGQFSIQKRQSLTLPKAGEVDPRLGRQGWRWTVTRRFEVDMVLKRIRPLLLEKAGSADAVLAFVAGVMTGAEAAEACRAAKRFSYPADLGEPPRRSTGSKSEQNPMARLSFAAAEDVRKRVASGERQIDVARALGVSKTMISRIVLGKTYKDAPRFYQNA